MEEYPKGTEYTRMGIDLSLFTIIELATISLFYIDGRSSS